MTRKLVGKLKYKIDQKVVFYSLNYGDLIGKIVDVRIKTKRGVRYIQYKVEFLSLYWPHYSKNKKSLVNSSWWLYENNLSSLETRDLINTKISKILSKFSF